MISGAIADIGASARRLAHAWFALALFALSTARGTLMRTVPQSPADLLLVALALLSSCGEREAQTPPATPTAAAAMIWSTSASPPMTPPAPLVVSLTLGGAK